MENTLVFWITHASLLVNLLSFNVSKFNILMNLINEILGITFPYNVMIFLLPVMLECIHQTIRNTTSSEGTP